MTRPHCASERSATTTNGSFSRTMQDTFPHVSKERDTGEYAKGVLESLPKVKELATKPGTISTDLGVSF